MQRIEFSELTNRLHRNAVGAAALIISIKLFNVEIGNKIAGTLGIEINKFTTNALKIILCIAMTYHFMAILIRAYEVAVVVEGRLHFAG